MDNKKHLLTQLRNHTLAAEVLIFFEFLDHANSVCWFLVKITEFDDTTFINDHHPGCPPSPIRVKNG